MLSLKITKGSRQVRLFAAARKKIEDTIEALRLGGALLHPKAEEAASILAEIVKSDGQKEMPLLDDIEKKQVEA